MKATLTFSLPEDAELFDDATHGTEWRGIVAALDETLRQQLKYGPSGTPIGLTDDQWQTACERFRDMLRAGVAESNLALD